MKESKHDCKVQVFAPGDREIVWVTGCLLHLFQLEVGAVEFWFGQIEIPTGVEDIAKAFHHYLSNNLEFCVSTTTHGGYATPYGMEYDDNDMERAVLSVSCVTPWQRLPTELT